MAPVSESNKVSAASKREDAESTVSVVTKLAAAEFKKIVASLLEATDFRAIACWINSNFLSEPKCLISKCKINYLVFYLCKSIKI